ncbi:ricin B lectin domain-containing protein [Schizophyllum amplum]|uniref:Ricin B lectin domain-containing protein n=1 Tax=Schizophyllum amplum TaxID=97359 RepID=A0A550CH07_9AGAR|nr:ricin B lectin domain-containing protein [Auriculariopsis ampla]
MLSVAVFALLPVVLATPFRRQATASSPVYIHPNGNTDFCLGAAGTANGAPVDIYDCSTKISSTPAWVLDSDKQRFQLSGTQMCLDAGNNLADGVAMKIWQCYDNLAQQSWNYLSANQHFTVGSGPTECLDLRDGNQSDGATTQTWACSASNTNQKWTTTAATASTSSSATPSSDGQVLHPNGNSGKCLNVAGDAASGTPVQMWVDDCDGSDSQNFILSHGSTQVKLAGTNFCLDAGDNISNGVAMKIWLCDARLAQQTWYYTEDNRIAVEGYGQCLDVSRGSLDNGNAVQTWACTDGNTNQIWN